MNVTECVFIDLSSIAYPIWHVSQSEADPNHASQQIVARVRALTQGHAYVAVCCDSGRSFRHEIATTYKANREAKEAPLQHQIALACDALKADGFPVWSVRGFEADDLIASGVTRTLEIDDATALVVTGDKDLLQLVNPRVRAMSVRDGSMMDEEGVAQKFGVLPGQMRDYLTLVGDTSDNIAGAKGLGPKKAADLLAKFGALDTVYERMETQGAGTLGLPLSTIAALKEFKPHLDTTRRLIALRSDVEIPFDEILKARTPQAAPTLAFSDPEDDDERDEPLPPPKIETPAPHAAEPPTALAVRESAGIVTGEVVWERQLDPRSMKEARMLATDLFESRMFSAYGSPHAVLSTIMVGRELGVPAMSSLRTIYNIEGKHSLSASLMVAIVLRSGLAEYFEPIEFSADAATYETKRRNGRNPIRLTHTFEMGVKAWPKSKADWQKAFDASGWGRNPTDMLVARAQARLARLVYPDLLAGLYTPEELEEIRLSKVAA